MKYCVFIISLLLICSCGSKSTDMSGDSSLVSTEKSPSSRTAFKFQRGVNISHWLSQSDRRGEERNVYFTEAEVKAVADAGFDHIRLPIDEEQMWDEDGNKEAQAFQLLHNALGWAKKHKLNTLVDLHIVRSHHFLDEDPALFIDEAEQKKFGMLWKQLSAELIKYPVEEVAYELLNEAVAKDHNDWNKVYKIAYNIVRENEPNRVIFLGPNRWQNPEYFEFLDVPSDDPNIVLSYHFYKPMPITHYESSWTITKDYHGPISYPGIVIEAKDTVGLDQKLIEPIAQYVGETYNKEVLESMMTKAFEAAEKHGLPLYCGEFGAYRNAPDDVRFRWYGDVISILEARNIAWAAWDLKGGFAVLNEVDLSLKIPREVLFQD